MMAFGRVLRSFLLLAFISPAFAQAPSLTLPPGYYPLEKSRPIIEKMGTLRLAPDLGDLGAGERTAVAKLLQVGAIFQTLYEQQLHPQAAKAYAELQALDRQLGSPEATRNLLAIYRINSGPIAATLDNQREAFLPVEPAQPGCAFYPWGIDKSEVEAWVAAHPDDADAIFAPRTVVRRADAASLRSDLAHLSAHPVLDTLQPGLRQGLERRLAAPDPKALYAVPYAVAYADEMIRAYTLINQTADAVAKDDFEFARFLRDRGRDLLSNDYESGDADWVTSHFKNLNVQLGAYETYDDGLFGVKASFGMSLSRIRRADTDALRVALRGLQALEDSLPYATHKSVRADIPIGLYDVIADFGESRSTNTASIEPNETYITQRYGRIIQLRANIIEDATLRAAYRPAWEAIVAPPFRADLTARGGLNQVMWHEVGHYLGVDTTKDGRPVDVALQEDHNVLEEMKADLVSMFVADALHRRGYHTDEELRAVYASGIFRTTNEAKPRRDQIYETMEVMQFNYFLEQGLVRFDAATGTISIDYTRYHRVVGDLLAAVFELQYQGDKAAADRFIARYSDWKDDLHGVLGAKMLAAERYRFWLMDYAALGQ